MQIRVLNYVAIASPIVQAFLDIEVDGWLRFIGLNYLRDGSLRAAQLKKRRNGNWLYFPAVVIPDDELRELLAGEILAAIHAHIETLPPERRAKPPRVEQKPVERPGPEPVNRPLPVRPVAIPAAAKPKLPPPLKLLANLPRRRSL